MPHAQSKPQSIYGIYNTSTMARNNLNVLIHGHLGQGNLGDELMLIGLLDVLKLRLPSAFCRILYGEGRTPPHLSSSDVIFLKRNWLNMLRELPRSDILVIAGGTHVASFHTSPRHTFGILRYLVIALIAKLIRKKIWFLSVGIGPFETKAGHSLAKRLARLADFVSVRDETSQQWLRSIAFPETKMALCYDAAMLTPRPERRIQKPTLGISVMPYYATYASNAETDAQLVACFSAVIREWLKLFADSSVYLISFLTQDSSYSDANIVLAIKRQFASDDRVQCTDQDIDIYKTVALFGKFTHFISMRYHSQVLAHLFSVPQLCIAYHRKLYDFARDVGIPRQSLLSIDQVLQGKLLATARDFFRHPAIFKSTSQLPDRSAIVDSILPAAISNELCNK